MSSRWAQEYTHPFSIAQTQILLRSSRHRSRDNAAPPSVGLSSGSLKYFTVDLTVTTSAGLEALGLVFTMGLNPEEPFNIVQQSLCLAASREMVSRSETEIAVAAHVVYMGDRLQLKLASDGVTATVKYPDGSSRTSVIDGSNHHGMLELVAKGAFGDKIMMKVTLSKAD